MKKDLIGRRKQIAILLAFIAVILFSTPLRAGDGSGEYSDLFIFGDSFSDTGNVFSATNSFLPPDPPYYRGRFSDGPVWVERLAGALGLEVTANGADPAIMNGNNFAVGGARLAEDVPVLGLGTIPSLRSQAELFIAAMPEVPGDALYVVFGGHNDLRFAADPEEGFTPREQEEIATTAIAALREMVTALAGAGAKTFLVPNIADLGITPEALVERENAAAVSALTVFFNTALASTLDELETGLSIRIVRLDIFAFGNEVIDDAINNDGARFGITNVEVPTFKGAAGSPGMPARASLFSDSLHVSAVAHRQLGFIAFTTLTGKEPPTGGYQRPGDCNQDGKLDISDAVCLLGFLFLGEPTALPCAMESGSTQSGVTLLDANGDSNLDIADGVAVLTHLFGGGPAPVLGTECRWIMGCGEACQ